VNNVLNIQLIEQLIVADDITPTIEVFCQKIYDVFQSQLESFNQLTLYQQQNGALVEHITLPDTKEASETLTAETHKTLWSAMMNDQQYLDGSDIYLPLQNDSHPQSILKFTINNTEERANIHWAILKTMLSREFHTILTHSDQTNHPPQHLLEAMIDITYQISLTENDTEIFQLLFQALPESVTHIALYRFNTPLLTKQNPNIIRLSTVADRESTTVVDEDLTLEKDTTFADGLSKTLLDGKFVIQNNTGTSTHQLPSAVITSLQSTPIQSFVLSGLRAGKQLMGFIVFGSDKSMNIDSQYHRNLRILADQMGATYENRDLLRRTEVILMETQVLYAISNELALTTDLASILQVLFLYFGENADTATLLEVEYDNAGLVKESILRYQLRANNPEVFTLNKPLTEYVPLEELHQLQSSWTTEGSTIYFVEDSSQDTAEFPNNLFRLQKIASCILIPLVENKTITHLISINWKQKHSFNDQIRNLLKTVRNQLAIIFENQRLLERSQSTSKKLEEQVKIQRALNDLATFAGSHQDEKLLLDKGAETLLEILQVDHVGIMLIDEDGEVANLISDAPAHETTIRQIPLEGDLWGKLARGEMQIVEHVNQKTDIPETAKQSLAAMNIKSTILLPFIDLSGNLIGSVGLDSYQGVISLSEDQQQIARLINTQLVSQLQNLRLLKDSQLFANQMQQIARFGETVQARLEVAEILQTTLHFANRILDIEYINIVLYDDGLQALVVKAYHMNQEEVILPANKPTIPIENTVIGTVWKKRDPLYVRHMDQSPYNNPFAPDIETLYAVAVISQGVTRGVIEIGRSDTQGIRNIDRSVLIQMANQFAVALENATTYVQSQRLAQNKALANEIALQLQQQVDIDSLLNTTVTELGKALGAKRARIRLGVQQSIGDN